MSNLKYSNFEEDNRIEAMANHTYPGGVRVDPMPITAGQDVTILYSGLLANSGADQVFLHLGYGDSDKWEDTQELRMEKLGWGWAKVISADDWGRTMNLCFRDSASNWDNNSGHNWSFQIHNG
ncbi:carbohydrate-binding protein [Heliophilum fasciatum]|uniref:Putative carbohydrate-binding protein with starch-binding CBM53 n=1 Tax=Heliophilum fasciatum TaxID=35700 RepID=A0A4R2RUS0_9FIRM|nr:carbohydrate-binding protein [Heliophilum fasciatum]MCW2277256.1 hypothetical protein [Heliophilum fasciatum]TCP68110.1 putative carbohydrate-binding protein with starch-binding CBM53 [Heliophilum fasciatum]